MYYPCSKNKDADQLRSKLICAFVFAYAKIWFSHDAAHIKCFMLFAHVDAVSKYGLKSRCWCNTAGTVQLNGKGASGVILDTHLSFRCSIKEQTEVTMSVQHGWKYTAERGRC